MCCISYKNVSKSTFKISKDNALSTIYFILLGVKPKAKPKRVKIACCFGPKIWSAYTILDKSYRRSSL